MHMPVRISRTLNLNLHDEDAKQEVVVVAGQFVRDMAPGQSPSSLFPQQERPVRMGAAGIASPKRAVSLSRDGASVSLLAKGEREPVVSGPKQGAKPTEVYGFVGAISTLVAFVVFIIWAYLPESWLHAVGITYYPSRYWAMAIPSYLMVAIFFICTFYTSLNYIATPPPHSLNTLFAVTFTFNPYPQTSWNPTPLYFPSNERRLSSL